MNLNGPFPIYDMSINILATWEAHSLSNIGNNGSTITYGRKQVLHNGIVVDSCSGNIIKHFFFASVVNYLAAYGQPLCKPCASGDSQHFAGYLHYPLLQNEELDLSMNNILQKCASCDLCGFLITTKKKERRKKEVIIDEENIDEFTFRQGVSKDSLIRISNVLALPNKQFETPQFLTRRGDETGNGQIPMTVNVRSGMYAYMIRYLAYGVGADIKFRKLYIKDEEERLKRHVAALNTLRDIIITPVGAMTARMSPHLTALKGVIFIVPKVGSAPTMSGLDENFIERSQRMTSDNLFVYTFDSVDSFYSLMNEIIKYSYPAKPAGE